MTQNSETTHKVECRTDLSFFFSTNTNLDLSKFGSTAPPRLVLSEFRGKNVYRIKRMAPPGSTKFAHGFALFSMF